MDINFGADVTALVDKDKLQQKPMTDSERRDRIRDLITKQTYEAAKLESDLRTNEIDSINNTINVRLMLTV